MSATETQNPAQKDMLLDPNNETYKIDGKPYNGDIKKIDETHIEIIEQKQGINGGKDELNIIIREKYKYLYDK